MQTPSLICGICDEEYDLRDKIPRDIPGCEHQLCEYCLRAHMNKNLPIVCQADNNEVRVNMASMNQFPPNDHLIELIQENQMSQNDSSMLSDENESLEILSVEKMNSLEQSKSVQTDKKHMGDFL
jgi:hypothetical protein